jgi:CRISPR-associated DxTHG motif protein
MPVQNQDRPTVGQLVRTHTFRFLTVIATWVLIFAAFIYHPDWIRGWLRFMTHLIESGADLVPEPWGARLEVMLRELGGMIWIQVASVIVLLRLLMWVPFHIWRLRRDRNVRY